jgi:hypothetical protein
MRRLAGIISAQGLEDIDPGGADCQTPIGRATVDTRPLRIFQPLVNHRVCAAEAWIVGAFVAQRHAIRLPQQPRALYTTRRHGERVPLPPWVKPQLAALVEKVAREVYPHYQFAPMSAAEYGGP